MSLGPITLGHYLSLGGVLFALAVIGIFLNRRNLPRLTPREQEIVALICRGMKNKQIADKLSITTGTVKVHLMHIFEKTGVKDRFELALEAHKLVGMETMEEAESASA